MLDVNVKREEMEMTCRFLLWSRRHLNFRLLELTLLDLFYILSNNSIAQWVSGLHLHQNCPEGLVGHRLMSPLISRLGWGMGIHIYNCLGDAVVAGPPFVPAVTEATCSAQANALAMFSSLGYLQLYSRADVWEPAWRSAYAVWKCKAINSSRRTLEAWKIRAGR